MNPQHSPWMKIADKHRQQSIQRQLEERQLQKMIKQNYKRQLNNQINLQKELRRNLIEQEKKQDKNLIRRSMQDQQRTIEIQNLKSQASNERQFRVDLENQYHEKLKHQREIWKRQQQRQQQNRINQITQQKMQVQKQEAEKKKQMLRQDLKDMIEIERKMKKLTKEQENQLQNYKLNQQKRISQNLDKQRVKFLTEIKQKAATIDYGSHQAFQEVKNTTLVQRKKQQWQAYRDSIEQQQRLRQFQKQQRINKMLLNNHFRNQLKDQISTNQKEKHRQKIIELNQNMAHNQKLISNLQQLDEQRRVFQRQKKRILQQQLQRQMAQKQSKKYEPYLMEEREYKMNLNVLQGSTVLVPGQTYNLDPHRKRQLQTVAKSMSLAVDNPLKSPSRYLAEKGRNILQ